MVAPIFSQAMKGKFPPAPDSPPKKRQDLPTAMARVAAVGKAGRLVGHAVLAERSGIPERTLRSYAKVELPLPDRALVFVARALRAHAAEVIAHAEAIEAMAAEGGR